MLMLVPIGLGAALVSDERSSFEGRVTWLGLGLAAQVVLIIVVRIGVALGAQHRSLTTALVVVLAAGARATVIALLSEPLGLSDPLAPDARVIAATGTFTLWMIVIGAGAQASFNYRQSLTFLLHRVNIARAEASAFTKVWNDRLARMGNSASELLRVATKLHDDIQKRLRPVSHRLWFGLSNRQAQHRFVTAMLHEPLPIAAIAGSSLVLYVWIIAQGFGAWFALLSGVSINICFTSTLIAGRFLHQRRPGLTVQLATIFAATLATGAAASVFFSLSDLTGIMGLSIANLIIIVSLQAAAVSLRSSKATLVDLGERVEQLENERVEVASHLHSTVQSRWTATALQLEHAARTGDTASTQRALQAARDLTQEGETPLVDVDSLSAMAQRWEGIADVSIVRDDPLPSSVATTVLRLVEEAIANSVRHGRARHISVNVKVTNLGVEIQVTDDGVGLSSTSTPGLGSRWRDHVAVWNLTTDASGTRLSAVIALT